MTTPRTRRSAKPKAVEQIEETPVTLLDVPAEPADFHARTGLADRVPALRPLSPAPTYLGIAVTAVGFLLILIAWNKTAPLTNVALQIPYLVSAGLTGLGLVMVGVATISVAAKRRDAALREQQTALLADALRELSAALEGRR